MAREQASPQTARVLIAEDDGAMRQLLEASFRAAGICVETVGDGQELKRRLSGSNGSASEAEVVISDVRMPGLSGLGLLQWLGKRGARVSVILITCFGDAPTHRRARQLGAVAVLDKPFAMTELLSLVQSLLDERD
jgi:DNA-binding NtrC family response regulator